VENGPAYKAGIRNGDLLTEFNGKFTTNANNGPTYFSYTNPAGTKLNLTLKRDEKVFDAVVTLEDIFPSANETEPQ
jgi:C-terminal processing protease CtpA/Prc